MASRVIYVCDWCKRRVDSYENFITIGFPNSFWVKNVEKFAGENITVEDTPMEVCSRGCAHDTIDQIFNKMGD